MDTFTIYICTFLGTHYCIVLWLHQSINRWVKVSLFVGSDFFFFYAYVICLLHQL